MKTEELARQILNEAKSKDYKGISAAIKAEAEAYERGGIKMNTAIQKVKKGRI